MGGISAIGTSIGKTIANATKSKPAVWLGKKFEQNPEGALAAATVTSIILKDGIGCVMYVTQSLNNKKIPDEKRKFVAALDLTNGVLMIAAQIAMYLAMRKYSGPIFEKLFKKSFNPASKINSISRVRKNSAIVDPTKVPKKSKVEKDYEEVKKDALGLFKFVVDIAAATIVGKRVIVPLIATPLAKKVEKKLDAKKEAKVEDSASDSKNEVAKEIVKEEHYHDAQIQEPNFANNPDTNLLHKFQK